MSANDKAQQFRFDFKTVLVVARHVWQNIQLALIIAISAIFVASLIRSWFGLCWLRAFDLTLNSIIEALTFVTWLLFFSWFTALVELIIWLTLLLASLLFNFDVWYPRIHISSGILEFSFCSVLLARLMYVTEIFISPEMRRDATEELTIIDRIKYFSTGPKILVAAHGIILFLNENIYWKIISGTTALFKLVSRREMVAKVGYQFGYFFAGCLLLGYVKLVGYIILVYNTRTFNYKIAKIRRQYLILYTIIFVFVLALASIVFIFSKAAAAYGFIFEDDAELLKCI